MTRAKDPKELRARGRKPQNPGNDVVGWAVIKLRQEGLGGRGKGHSVSRIAAFVADDVARRTSKEIAANGMRDQYYRVEARRRSEPVVFSDTDQVLEGYRRQLKAAGEDALALPVYLLGHSGSGIPTPIYVLAVLSARRECRRRQS